MISTDENPWAALEYLLRIVGQPASGVDAVELIRRYSMTEDDTTSAGAYWEAPDAGIALLVDNGIVESIFLHAEGKDGFAQYQGHLPECITFRLSRERVRASLGAPDKASGPVDVAGLSHGGWDRFEVTTGVVHLTYAEGGWSISLITLGMRGPVEVLRLLPS